MFCELLRHFFGRQGCAIECQPRSSRAFDPALDRTEKRLHKDGLRARPPTPNAPQKGGGVRECEAGARENEKQKPDVLRVKPAAKQVEHAVRNIEQHQWVAIEPHERHRQPNSDQAQKHEVSCPREGTFRSFGVKQNRDPSERSDPCKMALY